VKDWALAFGENKGRSNEGGDHGILRVAFPEDEGRNWSMESRIKLGSMRLNSKALGKQWWNRV